VPVILARALNFIVSGSITGIFFINLCNLIYRCGCRSIWAGADIACNIHMQGTKHCPWCSHGSGVYAAVLTSILVPQLVLSAYPSRWGWFPRLAASVAAFPIAGLIIALAFGLADGYWN
jgi:hypothetical protein